MTHASSFCEKTADLPGALKQHKVALATSQKALKKESVACGAIFSVLGTVHSDVSGIKADNWSFKELTQKLEQNCRSPSHEHTDKRLDCFSATITTGMLGFS